MPISIEKATNVGVGTKKYKISLKYRLHLKLKSLWVLLYQIKYGSLL